MGCRRLSHSSARDKYLAVSEGISGGSRPWPSDILSSSAPSFLSGVGGAGLLVSFMSELFAPSNTIREIRLPPQGSSAEPHTTPPDPVRSPNSLPPSHQPGVQRSYCTAKHSTMSHKDDKDQSNTSQHAPWSSQQASIGTCARASEPSSDPPSNPYGHDQQYSQAACAETASATSHGSKLHGSAVTHPSNGSQGAANRSDSDRSRGRRRHRGPRPPKQQSMYHHVDRNELRNSQI